MMKSFERVSSIGVAGQPPQRARQIALTNQIAILACTATVPYQVFYLFDDTRYYMPILLANLVFMACYVLTLPVNRIGRADLARNIVLATVYLHLFAATYYIGSGTGVHLFYFPLSACSGLFFAPGRRRAVVLLIALATALYLVCQYAFPHGSTPIVLPEPVRHVMFVGSASGAILFAGVFSYLFSREIDRAETALTRSNEELARLSGLDPLTGLANRRTLDDCLAREFARLRRPGQHMSVLLCDVDDFKAYNDHFGHLAGDACLQRVADVLSGVVHRVNDVVARYGGEEFVLVLPATDCAGAVKVADEARALVRALEIPHPHSSAAPIVTLSVGVSCAQSADVDGPEDLIRRADAALYEAKRTGRDRVVRWGEEGG